MKEQVSNQKSFEQVFREMFPEYYDKGAIAKLFQKPHHAR